MFTEILVYIALFAALFGSAFTATFQTIDTVRYLQTKKATVDNLYFFQARLDSLVQSSPDWKSISLNTIVQAVPDSGPSIESFSSQIFDTATSSSKVLLLTFGINKRIYTFLYVQEK